MITSILTEIRPFLEAAAFLATVVVAFLAARGLRQIALMKYDIATKNDRAGRESAVHECQRYLCEFCKKNSFYNYIASNKIALYTGPIGDFTLGSLKGMDPELLKKRFDGPWLEEMNILDSISATFVHGLADEEVGFKIIGKTFCHSVQDRYDILASVRDATNVNYYESVVALYKIWSARLSAEELKSSRASIEQQLGKALAAIPSKSQALNRL